MKKSICLLLSLILSAALLTGCSLLTSVRRVYDDALAQGDPADPNGDENIIILPDGEIIEDFSISSDGSEIAISLNPATEESETAEPWSPTGEQMQKDDPVYELYSKDLEGWYFFHVPQINCQSPDANAINQAIAEHYGGLVEQGLADTAEGYSPSCYGIDYTWHWFEDVLVLRVWKEYPNDCVYYQVWCLDRATGIQLTNEDILAICGVSKEDFVAQATAAVTAEYYQLYPQEIRDMVGAEFYDEMLVFSQSAENIHLDMVMFPAEDGSLMLISPVGSMAGASSYERIYPYLPED